MSNNEFSNKRPHPDDDDASDSGDSVEDVPAVKESTADPPNRYEKLERLKREKRLAMNRECARARRRRKKLRMEMLENRVQELSQKNSKMQDTNEALRARVAQLEAELGVAKSSMAMSLSCGPDGPGGAMGMGQNSGPPSSLFGSRMAGFASAEATQAMIAEKIQMQRRAQALAASGFGPGGAGAGRDGSNGNLRRMAGAGGPGAGAGAGAGGSSGNLRRMQNAGFGAGGPGAGAGPSEETALRYMQLMKAKSGMAGMAAGMAGMGADETGMPGGMSAFMKAKSGMGGMAGMAGMGDDTGMPGGMSAAAMNMNMLAAGMNPYGDSAGGFREDPSGLLY